MVAPSRVVLAMSGGVDSSVAAHLLLRQGHEVIGVFMRHGEQSPVACSDQWAAGSTELPILPARLDHKQGCCSATDAEDARRVAEVLSIPFYALNLQEEFNQIIDYFVDEYSTGRTPNPCVMCNNWIKFGKLFDYADSIDAQYVATGHYAQLMNGEDRSNPLLCRGVDTLKDQSYVLFGIDRQRLSRMLLPVGNFCKAEIRELAMEFGMPVANKKDSQEICFVASGRYHQLVKVRRAHQDLSGQIVTTDGSVVGTHDGIERFTVGQRRRLGVALGEPFFVVRIERDTRRVVVGRREELARCKLTASSTNWLVDEPSEPIRCSAQIRYNSSASSAVVEPLADRQMRVTFDEPQFGVSPGQAVVCYNGNRVLGGGWIE